MSIETASPVVLVVEDDPFHGIWTTMTLERAGYEVAGPAEDERSALELIDEDLPDVAILDIDLSGAAARERSGRGRTSARVAAALSSWRVPFVIVSSHAKVAVLSGPEGEAARLTKPVRGETLLDAVRDALTNRIAAR